MDWESHFHINVRPGFRDNAKFHVQFSPRGLQKTHARDGRAPRVESPGSVQVRSNGDRLEVTRYDAPELQVQGYTQADYQQEAIRRVREYLATKETS